MGYYNFNKDADDEKRLKQFLRETELDDKLISYAIGQQIQESEWIEGNHKEFDQIVKYADVHSSTVEWKMDKMCISTGNCYVEYWCRGRDSGIMGTTADLWAQVVFSNELKGKVRFGVWRTEDFKQLVYDKQFKNNVPGGDKWQGSRAAMGFLVKESDLFGSESLLVERTLDIRKFISRTGITNA